MGGAREGEAEGSRRRDQSNKKNRQGRRHRGDTQGVKDKEEEEEEGGETKVNFTESI